MIRAITLLVTYVIIHTAGAKHDSTTANNNACTTKKQNTESLYIKAKSYCNMRAYNIYNVNNIWSVTSIFSF